MWVPSPCTPTSLSEPIADSGLSAVLRGTNLAALDVLVSVARSGSLSATAREQGVSQPAVSARVRALEELLDLPLVERSREGTRLTQDGKVVAMDLVAVMKTIDHLVGTVGRLHSAAAPRLRIAATPTVAAERLPSWLDLAALSEPHRRPRLRVAPATGVARTVLSCTSDVGFVDEPVTLPAGLSCSEVSCGVWVLWPAARRLLGVARILVEAATRSAEPQARAGYS